MIKHICITTAFICLLHTALSAQYSDVPVPAPRQETPIILRNATIHTGNGTTIEKGDLLILNGKIEEIGTVTSVFKNSAQIDLTGKHIWPSLIAPDSRLGLDEIEAVRATDDTREVGAINPNARAIITYNTDSRVIPTVRSNGILIAQIAPEGELITGTSSVVQLDAWTYEDAAYKMDEGVFLNWPDMTIRTAWWAPPADEQKKNLERRMRELNSAFENARGYTALKREGKITQSDARWEAMIPLIEKRATLYIRANGEKEIRAVADFAQANDLKIVIVGGAESYRCTDVLKARNIPVILRRIHALPVQEDEDIDLPFRVPKMLQDAGVQFCLSMNDFWNQRNLSFQAGTAAAYGLTKEQALTAVTLSTAKILGIDSQTGSLEKGKDANIVVTTGDLLDMRTAEVTMAFIQGRQISLDNKQKALYSKFKDR